MRPLPRHEDVLARLYQYGMTNYLEIRSVRYFTEWRHEVWGRAGEELSCVLCGRY